MKLRLAQLIGLFVLLPTAIVYMAAIIYVSIDAKKNTYNEAQKLIASYTELYAADIEVDFNTKMAVVRTLSQAYKVYSDMSQEEWKTLFDKMYTNVFSETKDIYCLWDSWELNQIDTSWHKPTGRITYSIYNAPDGVASEWSLRSLDGDTKEYAELKGMGKESISEPYLDNFQEGKSERKLMTSLVSPIEKENKFVGIVGVDITLDKISEMLQNIRPYEGSFTFMISNKGVLIAHPSSDNLMVPMDSIISKDAIEYNILQNIQEGNKITYRSEHNGEVYYYVYVPIIIGHTQTPWSIAMAVPERIIIVEANRIMYRGIIFGFIGLLIIAVLIYFISKYIAKPIHDITGVLQEVSKGTLRFPKRKKDYSITEITEMDTALKKSLDGLLKKATFANNIGQGNLEQNLDMEGKKDELGKALNEMRDSLAKARDEEVIRQKEDEKRRWVNEGLAHFADILRKYSDLEELSYQIIKELVQKLKANQGGLFILDENTDENLQFNLVSAYAFNRRKHLQKTIKICEGLVGQCTIEKAPIYLKTIPQDYIEIKSGLGGATPNHLLIVPLMSEETVLGVMEIASFKEIEKFQMEFVEKVAENVASSLLSVQVNQKTQELLEQTKQQSEQLRSQEEEMRQNMEEMLATQEESSRKQEETDTLMETINKTIPIVQYDADGFITNVNSGFVQAFESSSIEFIGKNIEVLHEHIEDYSSDEFWNQINEGKTLEYNHSFELSSGKTLNIKTISQACFDDSGKILHVLDINYILE
ncbi:MAG: hypothetical protein C0594_12085 [Marinilabiliales bacterium]|nr:MAG: hypothetical protein C0594_12085 [Marinilabiliales bacterium]